MVNLGPTDFQLGLLLNIYGNDGQNKFEVHISKNVATKMTSSILSFYIFVFWSIFLQGLTWATLSLWIHIP